MSDEPIMTETQVKTKTVSKATVALSLAFLGAAALAAAGAANIRTTKSTNVATQAVKTAPSTQAQMSLVHYLNYMKQAGVNNSTANDFWQIVASSNVFMRDSLVYLKKNPSKQNTYIVALSDAVKNRNYGKIQQWYNQIYSSSGFNFDAQTLQRNTWLFLREADIKKKVFNQTKFAAFLDARGLGKEMKAWLYQFDLEGLGNKPVNSSLLQSVLNAASKGSGGGSSDAGGGSGTGGDTGSSGGGASFLDCIESAGGGQGGIGLTGGHVGGGIDPTGAGVGSGSPTKDPTNPDMGGSGTGSSGGASSSGYENCFLSNPIKMPPSAKLDGEDDFDVASPLQVESSGQFDDLSKFADEVSKSTWYQSAKTTLDTAKAMNKEYGDTGLVVGFGTTFTPNPNDDVGGSGGPCGLGGLFNGGCFDSSEEDDCGPGGNLSGGSVNKDPVSMPSGPDSPGWSGGCGGGGASGAVIDQSKMNDFLWDPSPAEFVATFSQVGGKEQLTGFNKIK